ncbi:MAG TPA: ribosome biogenesis GTPase Der [Saprospiraceae bacterium]|nr:ribosome biogenesis GTPase Der [Saprospiraceae bacterium]
MSFTVAIVGRPNVGKSTLFNRLTKTNQAIVDDVSGVTRDRIYGVGDWNGKNFHIIDTGGIVEQSNDVFERNIKKQVDFAIEEASSIFFVVDAVAGITPADESVAGLLRNVNKKVFLVVNKADNHERLLASHEFWALGFEQVYPIAAISGSGTGELLDDLVKLIPQDEYEDEQIPKFAIIGQPNVGKSSLVNAFLGEERNIVTDIAGTTRDPIHSRYSKFGKDFILIDTAGIRKKSKVNEDLEFYSVLRAIRAVEEADVCFLVIDANDGIESQDMELFSLVVRRNKGIVILVNKWDLVVKETNTAMQFEKRIKEKLAPFSDVPVLFISALEKQRIYQAIEIGHEVFHNRSQKIKTSELNDKMLEAIAKYPPPSYRNHLIKIKYITQIDKHYPVFSFFCNYPDQIKGSYKQFIENQMRGLFNFKGVPIRILFKEK